MKGRDCSVRVGSESIMPSTIVLWMKDETLTMKQYIAKVAASCVYIKSTGELKRK